MEVGWYPGPPPNEIALQNVPFADKASPPVTYDPNKAFVELGVKYVHSNQWYGVSKSDKEKCRRLRIKGVEARKLGPDHVLSGQYGLFAVEKFSRFDIIGEYTGKIVGSSVNGHYVAALEDKGHNDSLGIDAENMGNEVRFINSYLNVAFKANVTMRTAYVDTYPHIIIVCTEDIYPGEEILLDYGEAYNKAYLMPNTRTVTGELSLGEVQSALPFCSEDSDQDV